MKKEVKFWLAVLTLSKEANCICGRVHKILEINKYKCNRKYILVLIDLDGIEVSAVFSIKGEIIIGEYDNKNDRSIENIISAYESKIDRMKNKVKKNDTK